MLFVDFYCSYLVITFLKYLFSEHEMYLSRIAIHIGSKVYHSMRIQIFSLIRIMVHWPTTGKMTVSNPYLQTPIKFGSTKFSIRIRSRIRKTDELESYQSSVSDHELDQDPHWPAFILVGWIRICIGYPDRDSDSGGQKWTTKIEKNFARHRIGLLQ